MAPKSKQSSLKSFIMLLTACALTVLLLHLIILSQVGLPLFGSKIILAYSFNYLVAISIYILLYKFREKYYDKLGFFFLGGSAIKFIVFFIFFMPHYKLDGDISKLEFATFFIPYSTCLIVEILALSKLLNEKSS